MNTNTRLAVACHVLALLALEDGNHPTSEMIARSVNTNPVVIRRLLGSLKAAGLVRVRAGVGGASLARPAEEISLLDAYHAVCAGQEELFHLHEEMSPRCYVAQNIHDALAPPFTAARVAMQDSLAKTSIGDIAGFISQRCPARVGRSFAKK